MGFSNGFQTPPPAPPLPTDPRSREFIGLTVPESQQPGGLGVIGVLFGIPVTILLIAMLYVGARDHLAGVTAERHRSERVERLQAGEQFADDLPSIEQIVSHFGPAPESDGVGWADLPPLDATALPMRVTNADTAHGAVWIIAATNAVPVLSDLDQQFPGMRAIGSRGQTTAYHQPGYRRAWVTSCEAGSVTWTIAVVQQDVARAAGLDSPAAAESFCNAVDR